ncbi:MAG: DNA mismatch repair endonuclease MutL [Clostridia bacterium]|nr:DNA mismatch repair endonuclease MutL [Clostridia bacterium]
MKIIKLDSSVYNKISAGEVVERPASVVKELVENAIDAGATKIEIVVANAGLDEIKVLDNGCGIEKEDLKTAFLPHATSKIRKAEDLSNIHTLGFRGEALPSIASVSMVSIKSKTADAEVGNYLKLRGGEVEEEGIAGMNVGTEITVSNLFFNTPARLKFLKTPAGEFSDVKSAVLKLIFANPTISISLFNQNEKVYSSDGKGLAGAIKSIFSEDMWQNLLPLNYEKNGVVVTGFASRSTYFKMNRTYQISIVNGRVCDNQSISSAISTVYQQYLMKRNYPVTVLSIELDPSKIDVNVHPTKAEVRFSDGNQVFSAV